MTNATTTVTNPNVTRSRLVLEIASELAGGAAADAVPDYIQPKVVLRHSRAAADRRRCSASAPPRAFSPWRGARPIWQ